MGNPLPLGGFRLVFPSLLAAFLSFLLLLKAALFWSQRPNRAGLGEKLGHAPDRAVPQGAI